MKKALIFAMVLMLLLAVLGGWGAAKTYYILEEEPSLPIWIPPEQPWETDHLELQRRLARWYNLNLTAENPEDGFQGAYGSVVSSRTGLVCYIELENGKLLPVYRDGLQGSVGFGFVHDMNSAFPVGDSGSHTVLNWYPEVSNGKKWAELPGFSVGDVILIHMLDQAQPYRVTEVMRTSSQPGRGCILAFYGLSGETVWICCEPEA